MAMNGADMGAAMKAAVAAAMGDDFKDAPYSDALWEAMGSAVVDYIKANAEVIVASGSSAGTYKVS